MPGEQSFFYADWGASRSWSWFARVRFRRQAKAIFQAVRDGDMSRVERLLRRNPHLANAQRFSSFGCYSDMNHSELLVDEALYHGHRDLAERLIVSTGCKESQTLGLAIRVHDERSVRLLVFNGAEPSGMNLFEAVEWGNTVMVGLLMEGGAHVNGVTDPDCPCIPLVKAVELERHDIVSLLLAAGADVTYCFSQPMGRKHSIHDPNAEHVLAVIRLLLDAGGGARVKNEALLWASERACVEVVKWLLDAGADANAEDDLGACLVHAIQARHYGDRAVADCLTVMRALLHAGADVNHSRSGETALHKAAECGVVEFVEMLLASGAEVNPRIDRLRWTPLFFVSPDEWKPGDMLYPGVPASERHSDAKYYWRPRYHAVAKILRAHGGRL